MTAHFLDVIRNYFKFPDLTILQSVLRHSHALFQSQFSVECYLVLHF